MTLEELRSECQGILRLLDDPHPGLFTWNDAVAARMKQIHDWWVEMNGGKSSSK